MAGDGPSAGSRLVSFLDLFLLLMPLALDIASIERVKYMWVGVYSNL